MNGRKAAFKILWGVDAIVKTKGYWSQEIQNRIQQILQRAYDEKEMAGASVLFVRNGKEELYCQSGFADIKAKAPIQRDTIFRLYSMTKPVTAAACMLLMERGVIDLLDPVSRYLPDFENLRVWQGDAWAPACRPVTVRDLLTMQSGLPYPGETPPGREAEKLFEESPSLPTVAFANALARCGLEFQPGTQWRYGSSADVMGAVIEVASGRSFRDFLKEELFAPLEMKDTDFYVPEEKRSRLAHTYEAGTLKEYTGNHLQIQSRMETVPVFQSGGAGLASTIDDYSHFIAMLLNGGSWNGKRILSPGTVSYMTSAQLPQGRRHTMGWESLYGYSYGSFMRILESPGEAAGTGFTGEYGWDGWLGPYFSNFPQQNASLLLLMQRKDGGTWRVTRQIRNVILAGLD